MRDHLSGCCAIKDLLLRQIDRGHDHLVFSTFKSRRWRSTRTRIFISSAGYRHCSPPKGVSGAGPSVGSTNPLLKGVCEDESQNLVLGLMLPTEDPAPVRLERR